MSPQLVGLIPAAGRGVRAYPYTATIPKSMLEVDGIPNLRRNVELLRDDVDVEEIYIVIGYQGDVIQRYFGDGSPFGVRIHYVENRHLDLELPYSVYLAGKHINTHCCMILADECYVGSNHRSLLALPRDEALVTCGTMLAEYTKQIKKNYSVVQRDGLIVDLVEKPSTVTERRMGVGTYLLHPDLFRMLADRFEPDLGAGPPDWTSWLASLAREGHEIRPFEIEGRYVNINSRDDLNYANYLVRNRDFENRRTSLVYVIEEEGEASSSARRFAELDEIDEVVVVARRNHPELEGASDKMRVLTVPRDDAPVGEMLRAGLDHTTGGILLLTYSDDTFEPGDVAKFLVYLRDADMVIGTRTTRQLIQQGTNMRGIVRAAHLLLAQLVQLLWWRFESRFSDVCCVYRGIWRSTYETIRDNLVSSGPEIYPEMVVEVLRARRRIVEIPINYYNRGLRHDYVWSRYQNATFFGRVLALLCRKRAQDLTTWFQGGEDSG